MWSGLKDFFICQPRTSGCFLPVDANEEFIAGMLSPGATVCCPSLQSFCKDFASPSRISVAVMRHGERLDVADPAGWLQSAAAKRYPFDCPLSPKGRSEVGMVARELAEKSSSGFSCVVSSPFLRCVETSVEVCRALGLPICIDMQLGEVFGPSCFGDWNQEEVMAMVPPDVRAVAPVDIIGEEPEWPESIEGARMRMVARVEQYAEWATRLEGANFVLVTHGDCVGACLTLALAGAGGIANQVVDKVDYCGWALLERSWGPGEPASVGLLDQQAKWEVQHGHVVMREVEWPCPLSAAPPEPGASACGPEEERHVKKPVPQRAKPSAPACLPEEDGGACSAHAGDLFGASAVDGREVSQGVVYSI